MSARLDITGRKRVYRTALGIGLFVLPLAYLPGGGVFLPLKRAILYATLGVCSLIWMCSLSLRRETYKRSPGLTFGGVYVAVATGSALWATNPVASVVESTQLVALLSLYMLSLAALTLEDVVVLTRFVSAAGLIVAILGILQYFGVELPIPSTGLPSATLSFRNLAASFLIGGIPLALIAWKEDPHPLRRGVWLVSAGSMLLLLGYTRTRGAWVGLAAGGIVAAFYLVRCGYRPALTKRQWGSIAVALTILMGLVSLDPIQDRSAPQKFDVVKSSAKAALTSITDAGADRGRLIFWRKTFHMIADHPFLGVGLDNWEFHYPRYDRGEWNRGHSEPVRPHNDLLWIWSELGLVGLIGFLGFVSLPVYAMFKGTRGVTHPATVAGFLVAVVALFTHGLFSFLREQPAASTLLWLSLLGLAIPLSVRTNVVLRRGMPALTLLFGLGALIVAIAHIRFELTYHLSKGLYDRGDRQQALTRVEEAVSYGPFDHRALFLRGRILQAEGRPDDARRAYLAALAYHPNYANTHHNLGGVYASLGQPDRAIGHFREALEIRPTYDQVRINLANTLVQSDNLSAAKREMQLVLQRPSSLHAEAHSLMGAIMLFEGDPSSAVSHLEQAVTLKPDYVDAYNNLGMAYEQSSQPERAIGAYRQLARHWRGDPAYLTSVQARIEALEQTIR